MTPHERPLSRLVVDGEELQILSGVLVVGQEIAGGLPGHSWWRIDASLAAPRFLPAEASIECDAGGQTFAGAAVVDLPSITADRTVLRIRGNGPLDPEP